MATPVMPPVAVPRELTDLASSAVGHPVTYPELVRIALATLAGVDPADYRVTRGGYRHGKRRKSTEPQTTA